VSYLEKVWDLLNSPLLMKAVPFTHLLKIAGIPHGTNGQLESTNVKRYTVCEKWVTPNCDTQLLSSFTALMHVEFTGFDLNIINIGGPNL
jgi:hypothetical protein